MSINKVLQVQHIKPAILKLNPQCRNGDDVLMKELLAAFLQFEKSEVHTFILDLQKVQNFSTDFIVLMLELTARAERRNGELVVLNIQPEAMEDLLTFNPKQYLTVKKDDAGFRGDDLPMPSSFDSVFKAPDDASDRSPGWGKGIKSIELPYDEGALYLATDLVSREAEEVGFPANEISRIKIAVYEACLNAIQHTRTARAQAKIVVQVEKKPDALQISVTDFGRGFQVQKTSEYNVTEAALNRRTGGMGLHIIRRAMDVVDYQVDHLKGNTLKMIKYLKK
jgi:serine/threonine-protein kinase RsbW